MLAILCMAGLVLLLAGLLAGWLWLRRQPVSGDHSMTHEEIRERIGEAWG